MVYTSLTLSWWRSLSYKTNLLICSANLWTSFYMIGTSVIKEVKRRFFFPVFLLVEVFQETERRWLNHVSFKKKRVNWFFMQIDCLVSIRVKHQSWMSGTFSFCAYSRVYYYYHYYYCYFYYFIFKLCFCLFLGDLVWYVFHFSPFLCVIAGIICTKSLYCL